MLLGDVPGCDVLDSPEATHAVLHVQRDHPVCDAVHSDDGGVLDPPRERGEGVPGTDRAAGLLCLHAPHCREHARHLQLCSAYRYDCFAGVL